MERVFPLGFPPATGFYLSFYILTLAIHVLFMNYVLAGTGYLALVSLLGGRAKSAGIETLRARILRDWMPFALGLTITAGVAPLLFIQTAYQRSFYTANLLGFHRWMSILPVLIVGYYLLYLLKSRNMEQWSASWRVLVSFGAFACFAWTGYSWTENHVLSRHEEVWPQLYASGSLVYRNGEIWLRLAVWCAGSICTLAVILAWQLRDAARRNQFVPEGESRRTSLMALVGIGSSLVCGAVYFLGCGDPHREAMTSPMAWPYLVLAVLGLVIQAIAWVSQMRIRALCAKRLALASLGVAMTIIGITVCREAVRAGPVRDLTSLYHLHEKAFGVGGFSVFLVSLLVVAALIAWCILVVRRALKTGLG